MDMFNLILNRMSVPRMRRLAPFSPTQISGCLLWLDANDVNASGTNAAYGNITSWKDKITGLVLTTSNANTLVSNSINSLPGVRFPLTQTNGYGFQGTITNPSSTYPIYIFSVINPTYTGLQNCLVGYTSNDLNIFLYNGYYQQYNTGGYINTNGTLSATSGAQMLTSVYNSSASFMYRNGTQIASGNTGTGTQYGGTLDIGGYPVVNDSTWQGDINEIILYNTALTESQRKNIEGYLAQKWGMKSFLTPGHPGVTSTIYPTPRTLSLTPRSYVTSFTPTGIAGSTLWLDAADPAGNGTTPSNGSSLASWTDKSGNGLTVSAASSQPTYATNAANGLGTVAFSGTQGLNAGSVTGGKLLANNGSSATFCVFSVSNNTENSCPFSWDDNTYTHRFMITWAGAEGTPGLEFDFGNWPARTQIATTGASSINFTNNTYYLVSFWQSGATAVLNVNGKTYTSIYTDFSGNWSSTVSRIFNVGTYVNNGVYNMKGNTAEIILYNTNIPSNFQQVEGYLAWKWGIQSQLPASHPYKSVSPNVTNPLNLSRPATLLNQYPTTKTTGNYRSALSLPSGIITSGLLSFFSFDNTFADIQNLITLTATGSVSYVAGRRNNAIYLANEANSANGTTATNYLTSSYTVTVPFSVSVWFNPTNTNRGSLLSTYNSVAVTPYSVNLYIASGSMSAAYNNIQNVGGTYALSTGTWYHAVITVNASNGLSLFVNGSQVGSTITQTPSLNGLMIGNIQDGGGSYPFSGYMDDYRIYNRVLSGSEITAIYNGTG